MEFAIKNKILVFSIVAVFIITIAALTAFEFGPKDSSAQAYELHTIGKGQPNTLGVMVFNNEVIQKEEVDGKYYLLIRNSTLNDHSSKGQTQIKIECTEEQFNYADNMNEGTSIWISFREKHSSKAGWEVVDISLSRPDLASLGGEGVK
jgi:hypothetical protein